jgi:hypothetical protein
MQVFAPTNSAAGDVVDVYVQCIKYRVDFFKIGFYQKMVSGDSNGRKKHECMLTNVFLYNK